MFLLLSILLYASSRYLFIYRDISFHPPFFSSVSLLFLFELILLFPFSPIVPSIFFKFTLLASLLSIYNIHLFFSFFLILLRFPLKFLSLRHRHYYPYYFHLYFQQLSPHQPLQYYLKISFKFHFYYLFFSLTTSICLLLDYVLLFFVSLGTFFFKANNSGLLRSPLAL